MSRFKLSTFLAIPVFLLTTFGLAHTTSAATSAPTTSADRASILDTKMALRDLWVEHAFWIRNYVLATHAGDQAQQKVAEAEVEEVVERHTGERRLVRRADERDAARAEQRGQPLRRDLDGHLGSFVVAGLSGRRASVVAGLSAAGRARGR